MGWDVVVWFWGFGVLWGVVRYLVWVLGECLFVVAAHETLTESMKWFEVKFCCRNGF